MGEEKRNDSYTCWFLIMPAITVCSDGGGDVRVWVGGTEESSTGICVCMCVWGGGGGGGIRARSNITFLHK